MYDNPFTPVFGNEPLILAGRKQLIDNVLRGLDNGPGDPNRVTIFTGPRGSGKTVLLQRIATEAEGRGWLTAHVNASEGMLDELREQVERGGTGFLPGKAKSRITEIQALGVGVARDLLPEDTVTWRTRMSGYLDVLGEQDVGLLFTVDETTADVPEMVRLVSTFQFFIREKQNVALLMAGLPGKVMQMFQSESISFLRRAFRRKLDPIGIPEVRAAMKKTIDFAGKNINANALERAAAYTSGFPFLIQLIGYHAFNQTDRKTITLEDVEAGIVGAREDMESMILDATLHDLSERDIQFLFAMLEDEEVSRIADITDRLGISASNASHYKRRLLNQGVLFEVGRGKVAFSMPMFKTLLAERNV
jgi:molybdopterin-guanine dinucleotide biosynthesis protein